MQFTEADSLYEKLEDMSVTEILEGINAEDAKVHKAVRKVLPQIEAFVEKLYPRVKDGGRLFYIGAGTSGRLGILDASEIPPTFGMSEGVVIGLIAGGDTAIRRPVENAEDSTETAWLEMLKFGVNKKDSVLGIAASGTTPFVMGGLRDARMNGLLTAALCCNPGSPVAAEAEIAIEPVVGPEFLTGSTRMKSGTAQKMVLNMISTSLMIKLGRVKGNRMVDMQLTNKKLIKRGTRMIMEELGIDKERALKMLLLHGSVRKAIQNFNP
ncbi:MAG: N-acetylmuramic acid 6-phosphate etherase [Bacteroidales bacterium]